MDVGGEYSFRGRSLGGDIYEGSWDLTHDIPDGPTLVSPVEGNPPQNPDATVVRWDPVAAPNGSPIIGYQVLAVQPETDLDALPKITQTVNAVETERFDPSLPLAFKIARVFDQPIEDIFLPEPDTDHTP